MSMPTKLRATYQNGVFVPLLNGENLDLPEDVTVEITLETIETNDAETLLEKSADEEKAMRRSQIEWLKAHRDEYAGQYVALDGDVLVGHGATIREAREQAKQNGMNNPFLTRVFAEETILSAGL